MHEELDGTNFVIVHGLWEVQLAKDLTKNLPIILYIPAKPCEGNSRVALTANFLGK
jgi:hypothetical protein